MTPLKFFLAALSLPLVACGSPISSSADDAGPPAWDSGVIDGALARDAAPSPPLDGGFYPLPDGGLVRGDRFVTRVVSFTPADCAGFGAEKMPDVVKGPPVGGGPDLGGVDVVSLGNGGEIVLSFEPNAIVDGPGADFIVFENPFHIGGSATSIYAEPGRVSVSDDGLRWTTLPCTATNAGGPPYGTCAGWHPVLSAPGNGISPFDPSAAGGDVFDLKDFGVTRARYVKIVDMGGEPCPTNPGQKPRTNGFDLDAISIVNAELP